MTQLYMDSINICLHVQPRKITANPFPFEYLWLLKLTLSKITFLISATDCSSSYCYHPQGGRLEFYISFILFVNSLTYSVSLFFKYMLFLKALFTIPLHVVLAINC